MAIVTGKSRTLRGITGVMSMAEVEAARAAKSLRRTVPCDDEKVWLAAQPRPTKPPIVKKAKKAAAKKKPVKRAAKKKARAK